MTASDWDHDRFVASLTGVSEATRVAYRRDVELLMAWAWRAGVDHPARIGRAEVRSFLGYMAERQYAGAMVARRVAGCRSYYRWAVRRGLAQRNPFASVSVPRTVRVPRILEDWELTAMLDDVDPADGSPQALQDQAVLEVLYSAGLRVAELCGLDLADLDLAGGQARVWGKGDRERVAFLGGPAVAAVEAWLESGRPRLVREHTPAEAVFLGSWGHRLNPRGVRRTVDRRAPRRTHPHQIRHTMATQLYEGGCDLRALQELLGHADLDSTTRYARVRPQHLRQVVADGHPRGLR